MERLFSRTGRFVAALLALAVTGSATQLQLRLPQSGATVNRLTPTLAWTPAEGATGYEIWIDGILMGEVGGHVNEYVPFPLSFGRHEWKVVALVGNDRIATEPRQVVIDDAPLAPLPKHSQLLRLGWTVESSLRVGMDGGTLSMPGVDTTKWARTSLPATVLTALVRNGVYPNPYVALNNIRIPDANDQFNQENDLLRFSHIPGKNPWSKPYWYRTTFTVEPAKLRRQVWLVLNEINYRADVWFNGKQIGTAKEVVGMERSFRFNVTNLVQAGAENVLAVAIHPLDHPGLPEKAPVTPLADPGRNMGADTAISLNYAKWDCIGWDWQPEVKDRDMGITEDVYLEFADNIELRDVYVTTDLPLPDTSHADLAISFDTTNHGKLPVSGTVRGTLFEGSRMIAQLEQPLTLGAGETRRLEWTHESAPVLRIMQPRLWWPAELGDQPLHTLRLEWSTADRQHASAESIFGIREFTTRISEATNSRIFSVNGRDLYGQGGNWVIEMLLNGTASRYEEEIELARRSNLNLLRVWGPTGAPPPVFFAAADRKGVLIWQDFLHDHWGTDNNKPGCHPEESLFEAATTAIIKRYRNHASLFLWCGGNEGPNPREELITKKLLPAFDPKGSRYYLNSSLSDGLHGGGPYHTLAPRDYFGRSKLAGHNSEIGPSGVPVWESVRQFLTLPPREWAPGQFPLDGEWAYHDANDRPGSDERKFTTFDQLVRSRFGAPRSEDIAGVRDYVDRSQLVGFEAYRAAIEALNKHRWKGSTGYALWKYNASWPSMTWQIVDWYLQTNAGFYAVRRAAGPLHVQLNSDDRSLSVINRTRSEESGMALEATVYDLDGKVVWNQSTPFVLKADGAQSIGAPVPDIPHVSFLKLKVVDRNGRVRSENEYWMNAQENYTVLEALTDVKLTSSLRREPLGDAERVRATVRNAGRHPAVLLRLRLVDPSTGTEQLPVYWSDNYRTVLPGETIELTADLPRTGAAGPDPVVLELSAHNLKPVRVE
ncbi:MAG: beta galactosidase jelly roll domain-containing protein [Opitutaceae bacterium]|nr:beta galactosidase jelly roll domain-containing protein [Opitutaceae bacterium]